MPQCNPVRRCLSIPGWPANTSEINDLSPLGLDSTSISMIVTSAQIIANEFAQNRPPNGACVAKAATRSLDAEVLPGNSQGRLRQAFGSRRPEMLVQAYLAYLPKSMILFGSEGRKWLRGWI